MLGATVEELLGLLRCCVWDTAIASLNAPVSAVAADLGSWAQSRENSVQIAALSVRSSWLPCAYTQASAKAHVFVHSQFLQSCVLYFWGLRERLRGASGDPFVGGPVIASPSFRRSIICARILIQTSSTTLVAELLLAPGPEVPVVEGLLAIWTEVPVVEWLTEQPALRV
jgi:hypothetical protein